MPTGPKPLTKKEAFDKLLRSVSLQNNCLLILYGYSLGQGYKRIRADGSDWYAHRLAYSIYNNVTLKSEDVIMHSCDNPNCIAKEHLILGAHKDNVRDKVNKNRHCFGEKHYRAKLDEDDVKFIRKSYWTLQRLADWFEVSRGTIQQVQKRTTWKHIK